MNNRIDNELKAMETMCILIFKHNIYQHFTDDTGEMGQYEVMQYLAQDIEVFYNPYDYYSGDMMPDICGSCHTYFGHTYGGRLRLGCHLCKDSRTARNRLFVLERAARVDYKETSLLVACTLYKYNIIGEDLS